MPRCFFRIIWIALRFCDRIGYIDWDRKMNANNNLRSTWKDMVVPYFDIQVQNSKAGNDKDQEVSHSG
jgi:hypothetical protein